MTTPDLLIRALFTQQQVAFKSLLELYKPSPRDVILKSRAEVERTLTAMKVIYFDLMEAGGPLEMKTAISMIAEGYESAPYFDTFPITTVVSPSIDNENHTRMRMKEQSRRTPLHPYTPIISSLNFESGDVIRTPMERHGLIMPAWFYVKEVVDIGAGAVRLRGWRLGENDQKARDKYREVRTITPDQYTFIERRNVPQNELGLEKF